ncbi:MAG: response regulator [Bacteroidetes bacterium]|nr:response regulator [Bacteroidota bacterium]
MPPSTSVVLIDDDHDDHEIFSIALREAVPSIKCIYFDSGKIALNKLLEDQSFKPDYIFLDLNMPGMTGIQFLETIKKQDFISKIPIIVYSTSMLPQEKEKALQMGAHRFFIKPSSHTELISLLKSFFES